MKKLYDNDGNEFAELNYCKEYFLNYSKHSHETFVITLFKKGCIEVEYHEQSKSEIHINEIVTFNPQQVHQTKSKIKTDDYYSLYVDEKWCKKLQSKYLLENESFMPIQNVIKDKALYKEFISIFEDITFKEEIIYDNLEKAFCNLFKQYTSLDLKKEENHLLCKKVEEYIRENLNEQITIEDIAKVVGYNESYITRIFKNYSGLTPHAFLVNKRIQEARSILSKNKRINLAQLSNRVGFYDQSHFSKAFKRMFAISPNKYRDS